MEFIFIDESEYNKKEKKEWFILCGVMINAENVLETEELIRELKDKHKINSLKELRIGKKFDSGEKLKITLEIVDILEKYNVCVTSIIFGDLNKEYYQNYFSALTFIMERFYLKVRRNNEKGMIICDSIDKSLAVKVSDVTREYLINNEVSIRGKSKGKIRNKIYPSILFLKDEHSELLQITDLICSSLQFSLWGFSKKNPTLSIKNNEDSLLEFSQYLKAYWKLFETDINQKVSGWGIKTWD